MNVTVDLTNASGRSAPLDTADLRLWTETALEHLRKPGAAAAGRTAHLSVRLIDETESADLNGRYRGKNHPTNVLSFSADLPEAMQASLAFVPLGDLAICAAVVDREAAEQGKPQRAHWAHMVVHGVLHLSGMDHELAEEAIIMEQSEAVILAELGYPDPYKLETDRPAQETINGASPRHE